MELAKHPAAAAIPRVRAEGCRACVRCGARAACERKAMVVLDSGEPPWIDASRCYGCRRCMLACPHGAIGLS